MQKHTKIYLNRFGYTEADFIPCEICGKEAVDIHHIRHGADGRKNYITNLIALCRYCHDSAHNEKPGFWRDQIQESHDDYLERFLKH